MADIGNTGSTSSNALSLAGNYRGIQLTTTEAGVLTDIVGRVSATGAHRLRAFLCDSGQGLLASSTVRTDVSSTLGYQTFTGFTYPLLGSTTYYIFIGADSGNTAQMAFDTGAAFDGYEGGGGTHDVDTPDDPFTAVIDGSARDYAVYATYTTGGGGGTIPPLAHHYRLMKR